MTGWSLPRLLGDLHADLENRLAIARRSLGHPVSKGDASENVWIELLSTYLPQRYAVRKATIVDSRGEFSEQIDVVVFDRQYSPLVFMIEGQTVIPAESVYAVFEAKQTINAELVQYAHRKAASVRRLHRTSLPIPSAGGVLQAKALSPILAGLLTFESDWNPPLGRPLQDVLAAAEPAGRLDIGCVAARGIFNFAPDGALHFVPEGKPATAFLLELIARLQDMATVPMIDVRAYAAWLSQPS